jgi:exopolysaccharide biosynthesis polyprenyl glycosylphosphotransferase
MSFQQTDKPGSSWRPLETARQPKRGPGVRRRWVDSRALAELAAVEGVLDTPLVPAAADALAAVPADGVLPKQRMRARFRTMLLAGNIAALIIAYVIAHSAGLASDASVTENVGLAVVVILCGLGLSSVYGLYSRDEERADHSTVDDLPGVLQVGMLVAWAALFVLWVQGESVSITGIMTLLATTMTLPLVSRGVIRLVGRRVLDTKQTTIIVGAGSIGQFLARKLIDRPVHGLRLVGFVDEPTMAGDLAAEIPFLGAIDKLPEIVARHGVERVLVAFSVNSHERTMDLIRSLRALDVQIDVVPRLFDVFGPNVDVHTIDGLPLMARPRASDSKVALAVKRMIDVVVALSGLVAFAPLLLILYLLVKLDSSGPAIFRAPRIGSAGHGFMQFKFRSMRSEYCSGPGFDSHAAQRALDDLLANDPELRDQYDRNHKLDRDPRVTRVGRFLRSSSLDELPQLWNVVRGDLSLVGPRPVTVAELARYGDQVPQLLSVQPGLTGYWQTSGRSALAYAERVRLDIAYVSSWSLKLDAQILMRTFKLLMSRSGAV